MKAPFSIALICALISVFSTEGTHSKRHHHESKHQSRGLINDLNTPSVTPACLNICQTGANWSIRLVDENFYLVYDLSSTTLAAINLGTKAAVFFTKDGRRVAFSNLQNGETAILSVGGQSTQLAIPDVTNLLQTPVNLPVLQTVSQIILSATLKNEVRGEEFQAIISGLPNGIVIPIYIYMVKLIGTETMLADGGQLFMDFFSIVSLLDAVKSGSITLDNPGDDMSISAIQGNTRLFSINSSGKVVSGGKIIGCLSMSQSEVLPGNIRVSSPDKVQIMFQGTDYQPSNILSGLVVGLGGGLGLTGATAPVNNLLTNVLSILGK